MPVPLVVIVVVVRSLRADCTTYGAGDQWRTCGLTHRAEKNHEHKQIFYVASSI